MSLCPFVAEWSGTRKRRIHGRWEWEWYRVFVVRYKKRSCCAAVAPSSSALLSVSESARDALPLEWWPLFDHFGHVYAPGAQCWRSALLSRLSSRIPGPFPFSTSTGRLAPRPSWSLQCWFLSALLQAQTDVHSKQPFHRISFTDIRVHNRIQTRLRCCCCCLIPFRIRPSWRTCCPAGSIICGPSGRFRLRGR